MTEETVSSVMTAPFVSINPGDPITNAAKTMRDATIGSLLVVDDDNRPRGILTRSDFVDFVADEANLSGEVPPAESLMTTDIVSVTPETSLGEATELMREQAIHHIPVVTEDDRVVGVVTTSDLADASVEGFDS
ncbi:MAG: CBS domain-containing protein [Haloarculaceae archaeon]